MNSYIFAIALFAVAVHSSVFASEPVGKVLFSSGDVNVVRADGSRQALQRTDQVFNSDRLVTGNGVLQVKFNDGGFMSLQKHSEMHVEDYNYEGSENGKESAIFSLIRGGLRALSGTIGHKRPGRYQLRTRVATIGIRGTAYSALLCQQDCAETHGQKFADGLHARTTEGTIFIKNDGGLLDIPAGKAGFVPDIVTIPTYTEFNPSFAAIQPRAHANSVARAATEASERSSVKEVAASQSTKSNDRTADGFSAHYGKSDVSEAKILTSNARAVSKVGVENFERFVTRANSVSPQANVPINTVADPGLGGSDLLQPELTAMKNSTLTSRGATSAIQSAPSISALVPAHNVRPVIGVQGLSPNNPQSLSIAPTTAESVTEILSNTNGLSLETGINQLNITNPLLNNSYAIPGNLSNNPLHP